jgi:hypothetical protein
LQKPREIIAARFSENKTAGMNFRSGYFFRDVCGKHNPIKPRAGISHRRIHELRRAVRVQQQMARWISRSP